MQYDRTNELLGHLAAVRFLLDQAGEGATDGDVQRVRRLMQDCRQRLLLLDYVLHAELPSVPEMDVQLRESLRQHDRQHGEPMQTAGTRGAW